MVDTPGFSDSPVENLGVLRVIGKWLGVRGLKGVRGVIYFYAITNSRLTGSARSYIAIFEQICGPLFLDQTVFVTTMWDKMNKEGMVQFERLHQELIRKYQHLHSRGTKFLKFNKDLAVGKDSAKAVMDVVAVMRPNPPQLQFASEVNASQLSPSGVRKTSAGKVVGKDLRRGFCTIL